MTDDKFAVAESVKALLAEYANHVLEVEQQFARDGLAQSRAAYDNRKMETRRKIIVGGAALAEARTNPEFGMELYQMLSRRVTDERDRKLIAFGGRDAEAELGPQTGPSDARFAAEAERRLSLIETGKK